jgi:uncharacterized membrane protein
MSKLKFAYLSAISLFGLWASFTILVEKIASLSKEAFTPSCNINPLLSCGSVMDSPQAATFGFPNAILGVIGFSMIAALAIMGFFGVVYPKIVYILANAGLLFAAGFSLHLFIQTNYVIGAICLYCVAVWFASFMLFTDFTLYNISNQFKRNLNKWAWLVGLLSWLILIVLIVERYQYQINLYFFN